MANNPTLEFFLQGLTHFREIGTFLPCSRFTAEKLARYTENSQGTVIELGAGTGVVTSAILKNLSSHQKLLSFEINERFCEILSEIKDPRLYVINNCAANIGKFVIEEVGCVISILPLSIMETDFKSNLFREIYQNLACDGRFVQFQYLTLDFRDYRRVSSQFGNVNWEFSLLNFPPGWIYSAVKKDS